MVAGKKHAILLHGKLLTCNITILHVPYGPNYFSPELPPNWDCHYCILEEQFSNDCLKTVTKAITLINHNRCKQHDELIRTGSNVTCSKHKKSLVYKVWLALVLLLIGWKNWCKMLKPITKHSISLKTSLSTTENRSVI